ncbi:O-antigen ligase family protein [uncultured Polaribacter sp.]|uniref:O-antigen ligase family protein n=1 Tax=uncultured Polaribacter sp. TaxID=174711 RepID=UPI00259B12FF|nr:O-antigen ligase family protein [uncultured Polaribacter sp.]
MLLNANELEGLSPNEIIQRSLLWIQNFAVVFIIGILISAFVKTKADLIKLEKIFLWNCFLFSITAIMAFLGFYDGVIIFGPGSFTGNTIQDYSRDIIFSEIYGISYSNLVFGVTTLSIVFLPTLKWSYLKKNIYLALIIFAVIISLKRLAIVSLIVVLLYYLIREKQKGRNTWLLVIPFLIFILGTTYYDLILKRFDGVLSSIDGTGVRDSSSDIRLDRIYLAIDAFAEQPLIGKGAGFLGYVHNGLFEVLGNLGLLGLLLFRPFFKLIFKKKFSFFFHNPWAISVFVFMFTLLLFESAVNRIEIMYFLGLLSGGAIAYNRLFSEHESKFTL